MGHEPSGGAKASITASVDTAKPAIRRRGRTGHIAVLAVAFFLTSQSVGAAEHLRIATYNIFVGNPDLDRSIAAILASDLDFVALQELSPRLVEVLDEKLAGRFPYRFFPDPSHAGGPGILSRLPLENTRYVASDRGLNGFSFAEFTFNGQRIQVANLHLDPIRAWTLAYKITLPWQMLRQGTIHRQELGQVSSELRPQMATIVMGDLNTFASMAAPTELARWSLTDSYAAVHPDAAGIATHRAAILGIPIGRRIDFIFHSAELRTVDSQLVPGQPSDHDMVVSALEWSAGARTQQSAPFRDR